MTAGLPFTTIGDFTLFTLVMGRMAGIFAVIPIFGGHLVPMRIKASAVLVMTLLLFPVLQLKPLVLPNDTPSLIILITCETLIGLTLGLLAQSVFAAVDFCGQLVGMQMGLSISMLFDPTMGQQTSTLALLQNLLAMLLFMVLGTHHYFLRAAVESYQVIPLGGWHMSSELLRFVIAITGNIFVLAIKLAAPVMAALLVTSVVLGVMARIFPQMNVFFVSMPLNIGIGFLLLGLSLPVFIKTIEIAFSNLVRQIAALIKLLT